MTKETKRWIEMAKMDLDVSIHLLNNYNPKPIEIICYHCQQAAEKAIKSPIIENSIPGGITKTHDLSFY